MIQDHDITTEKKMNIGNLDTGINIFLKVNARTE